MCLNSSMVSAVVLAAVLGVCAQGQTAPRSAYPVPLVKLSVSFDDETHNLERVRISSDNKSDYVVVTALNDELVRFTRNGREKTVYREVPVTAWHITDFERKQLDEIVQSLVVTLQGLEKDLAKEHFDRVLYLDSFLPRFLRGFYYFTEAIRDGYDPLPRVARIPESAFDVSLNSPKSDERLKKWRSTPQQILKLRIVCKEFAFQLKKWLKSESKNKKTDPARFLNSNTLKAYSLFVRVYFNLKPPPKIAP